MKAYFWNLWTDETRFVGMVRGLLVGVGTAAAAGQLPIPVEYSWIGALVAGLGGFMRSSTVND